MDAYLDPRTQAFLRYLDFPGSEPPVVLLAGLGLASTAVFPRVVVEPGLSNRRSIMVDMFGCGYSDSPDDFSYSIEAHATTLSGFLDHIGSEKYILLGHSMGGAVAIVLASMRPERVAHLILAEANLYAGGGLWSKAIAEQTEADFVTYGYRELVQNRRRAAINGDRTSSIALGVWQVASPRGLHRGAVSLVEGTQPVMWDQLIQLPHPRTFIFGSRSLEEYEEDRTLQRRLEEHSIEVAVVPDASHGMMAENPAGLAAVIVEAITRRG